MSTDSENKTIRIALLCATMVILGLMVTVTKGGCGSCDNSPTCRDEFFQVDNDHTHNICDPGASVEIVTSPPAPKPGIICHCPAKRTTPAPAASTP
jgi:hypothetical protein